MFRIIMLFTLFQVSAFGFTPSVEPSLCTCGTVTNLQKTGQTTSSLTFSWSAPQPNVQYRVWYTRVEDGYTSSSSITSSTSYVFTGLSAGHYTFYVQTLCGGETSSYVGIEDVINA